LGKEAAVLLRKDFKIKKTFYFFSEAERKVKKEMIFWKL